jgi:hypothetical protein
MVLLDQCLPWLTEFLWALYARATRILAFEVNNDPVINICWVFISVRDITGEPVHKLCFESFVKLHKMARFQTIFQSLHGGKI